MSKIILDSELKAKLNGLNEHKEICDSDGRTVGHFLPPDLFNQLAYAWAKAEFANENEQERARQEIKDNGGFSTSEAVIYLQQAAKAAGTGS
jgi:hypothetical protein